MADYKHPCTLHYGLYPASGVVMLFLDCFYYHCFIPTTKQALTYFTVSCCTFHTLGLYDAHLRGQFELGLIFGFELSSCCLYFVVGLRVRCGRKCKTSRSGFSSADEFLVYSQ